MKALFLFCKPTNTFLQTIRRRALPSCIVTLLWTLIATSSLAQLQLVKDVNTVSTGPGTTAPPPTKLTHVNGTLFFVAYDAEHGEELWKSDGTEAGTVLVKDVHAGPSNSGLSWLTNVGVTLFFIGTDTHGLGLWKSDGTEAGTVIVKDIYPGNASSLPDLEQYPLVELINIDGILYFTAIDETHGLELWRSDGTEAGTQLVQDIYPGMANSSPLHLTAVNGVLFFAAEHEIYGQALWKYTPPACQATGTLLREVWNRVGGTTTADIPLDQAPSYTEEITRFQGPSNVANHYAARYRGYICASQSGSYTFWVISDNESELYISTDADPANKLKIAYLYGAHVYFGQWEKYPSQKLPPCNWKLGSAIT